MIIDTRKRLTPDQIDALTKPSIMMIRDILMDNRPAKEKINEAIRKIEDCVDWIEEIEESINEN